MIIALCFVAWIVFAVFSYLLLRYDFRLNNLVWTLEDRTIALIFCIIFSPAAFVAAFIVLVVGKLLKLDRVLSIGDLKFQACELVERTGLDDRGGCGLVKAHKLQQMTLMRMRMGCESTLCDQEVTLDCEDCPYGYICCCAFDIALTESETKCLSHETLADGTKVLSRQENGACFYFNIVTKKCEIWDKRPEVCRKYSCLKDKRAVCIQSMSQPLGKQPNFSGEIRVCLSLAVLDSTSKHKTSPMMVHDARSGFGGVCAAKTVEIVGSPDDAIKMVKDVVEQIIQNRLGEKR